MTFHMLAISRDVFRFQSRDVFPVAINTKTAKKDKSRNIIFNVFSLSPNASIVLKNPADVAIVLRIFTNCFYPKKLFLKLQFKFQFSRMSLSLQAHR